MSALGHSTATRLKFSQKRKYFCKKSFARCLPIDTFAPAKPRGVAQLASVLAWGASGRPFESDHPDQKNPESH